MSKPIKFRLLFFVLTGFILIVANSCVDKALLPVVVTTKLTAISYASATCWGNVPADPGSSISARGICWSTGSNPTTSNSKATTTAGTGYFSTEMTGLTPGTKYYVRCFATNSTGTSYGSELSFSTLLIDISGNLYNTVTIGNQVWMAENLKASRYLDGKAITKVTDPTAWANLTTGAYCSYNNSKTDSIDYGNLYNWYAVNNTRVLAPSGWHIPTNAEWTTLMNYLGGQAVAGDKLKETGNTHWSGTYAAATNSSGFTALPGGIISIENGSYGFYNIGVNGQWWSSTSSSTTNAWSWSLDNTSGQATSVNGLKQAGFAIRCIKD